MRRHIPAAIVAGAVAGLLFVSSAGTSRAQTAQQSRDTDKSNARVLEEAKKDLTLPIEPLVGRYEKYTVQKGDTLFKVARAHGVGEASLARVNHLESRRVRPGQTLLLPVLHILPAHPADGIVLNVPERALYLFQDGKLAARYAVAVGKSDWQTALGDYEIRNRVKDPTWTPPKSMVEREGVSDEPVPPGPENPLGDRWMGWSAPGFGFHSTNTPTSIGNVTSHGCVRLYPEAARELFGQVKVGTPIHSLYRPVKLGEKDGRLYLAVYPDVYHTGMTSLAHVEKQLDAAGLLDIVDPHTLKRIVEKHDGYPHRILGADEPVTINGAKLTGPLQPTLARGRWIVPLRQAVDALGGTLKVADDGTVQVSANGHTLALKAGDKTAQLDGAPVEMRVAPTVVKGTTMVALDPLAKLAGARVAYEKGQGVTVTTGATAAAAERPADKPAASAGSVQPASAGTTPPPVQKPAKEKAGGKR